MRFVMAIDQCLRGYLDDTLVRLRLCLEIHEVSMLKSLGKLAALRHLRGGAKTKGKAWQRRTWRLSNHFQKHVLKLKYFAHPGDPWTP